MYHFCLGGEHKYKEGEIYVVYKGVGQRGGKFISYKNRIQNNYFEIKLKLINKVFNWIRPTGVEGVKRGLDGGNAEM